MAAIQCKMCGYMVELPDGATVGECPACGSTTTFPKLTSEHTEQLYARAEHFRRLGDFDKAVDAYEAIVRETPDDPEAYWGLVLSRFGIEYVEDPQTHERVPTCHRVQYESLLTDGDYQSALEHADAAQRDIYESEAKRISDIQKGILAISAQEKPFDVFICYKETTDGGSRTKDSTLAQDIYFQLVNAGYKVFFSRITLEDKLGQQYEPYIFAALNSAKVMLVVGTKREYFNAVWVRNEWSRYLALMKKDRSRLLIPCYRDMDAYDIPEELAMLQSQDMSKIGFIQDLLHGIKKVLGGNETSAKPAASTSADSEVEPLLKRIRIFLKTGDFSQACEYCNKVLDKDPENGEAYLLLLLAEKQLKSEEDLYTLDEKLESLKNFQLAMDFADAPVKARLQAYVKKQKDEWCYKELVGQYQALGKSGATPLVQYNGFCSLAEGFGAIGSHRNSITLKKQCEDRADAIKRQKQDEYRRMVERASSLAEGKSLPANWNALAEEFRKCSDLVPEAEEMARQCVENARSLTYSLAYRKAMELKKAKKYDLAIELFSTIGEYADSNDQILQCQEEKKRRVRRICKITLCMVAIVIGVFIVVFLVDRKTKINKLKNEAQIAYEQGDWQKMESLGGKLETLSAEEGGLVLAHSRELHISQLKKDADTAYKQGAWQKVERLGKELAALSAEDGTIVLARSRELHISQLKVEIDKAYEEGVWRKVERLGKELVELSAEEGKAALARSRELFTISSLKKEADTAYEQGDWRRVESLGKELEQLSAEEGQAILARSKECHHINQLKKEVDRAYEQGDWQRMEKLGKELEELSAEEGQVILAWAKEYHISQLKKNADRAYKQGDWRKVKSLGKKLEELSAEDGKNVLERARELLVSPFKKEADMAYEQGDWQRMEKLGKELEELSAEEGQAILARAKEYHISQLKKNADRAYKQGDWRRLESLGKELEELSAEEGQAILARARELRKVMEDEVRAGLSLYMVVNLQSWTVRHSKKPPYLSNNTCRTTELWLRWIPAGTFTMGSPKAEWGRYDDEVQHEVTLTSGYWMGIFEVTQKQWSLIMGSNPSKYSNPSRYKGETRPMECVSYNDIRGSYKGAGWPSGGHEVDSDSFLGKLRSRTGLAFDLPTEAQWEYACRAGTTTALNSGKNLTLKDECPNMAKVGRYKNYSDGKGGYREHTTVGSYLPNAWGLYDMHGNVWEWCLDWYPTYGVIELGGPVWGSYRVLRGGGWNYDAQRCRSASRNYNAPSDRSIYFGFRVVFCP